MVPVFAQDFLLKIFCSVAQRKPLFFFFLTDSKRKEKLTPLFEFEKGVPPKRFVDIFMNKRPRWVLKMIFAAENYRRFSLSPIFADGIIRHNPCEEIAIFFSFICQLTVKKQQGFCFMGCALMSSKGLKRGADPIFTLNKRISSLALAKRAKKGPISRDPTKTVQYK